MRDSNLNNDPAQQGAQSDQRLIGLTLEGDHKAFEEILRRYQKLVYNVIFQMVRSHEIAADLTQETFLKVYKSLSTFQMDRPLKPWLLRIATNASLNQIRDNKECLSLEAELESQPQLEPVASLSVADEVERRISQQELFLALEQLPTRQRNIFVLRYQHDLSYDEIAEVTGQTSSTIKSMLYRIRERLRLILTNRQAQEQQQKQKGGGE